MATARTYTLDSVNTTTKTSVSTYTASDASVHTITVQPCDVMNLTQLKAQIQQQVDIIEHTIVHGLTIDPAITGAIGGTITAATPVFIDL